jgi:hypothetical protein
MKREWIALVAAWVSGLGISLIVLGILANARISYAGGTGPECNEGGDPSMPKGCYGTCDSPQVCRIHPIQLVCDCR